MPMIRIELSAGRTQAQKQKVAEEVTQTMVAHCGCSPESVHVVFVDVQPGDWAVGGSFLAPPKAA